MDDAARDPVNFDDLVQKGLASLPVYAPEWTNHNPSDPGVTLVELLAYFSDMLLYRTERVTPAASRQFLRLLTGGMDGMDGMDGDAGSRVMSRAALQTALASAVGELAQVDCAVTADDYERLALQGARRHAATRGDVLARCVVNADLSADGRHASDTFKAGHVSVIVATPGESSAHAAARLRASVRRYLLPRCLLTTRLHVLSPDYLHIRIGFRVALLPGASLGRVTAAIGASLQRSFGLTGSEVGESASRVSFGTPIVLSAVARVIDDTPGVDYVEDVTVLDLDIESHRTDVSETGVGVQIGSRSTVGVDARFGGGPPHYQDRLVRDVTGTLSSIRLKPWELPVVSLAPHGIRVIEADNHDDATDQGARDE